MIEKIISGGQTGVDQAALFVAAKKFGLAVGGWCPTGGLDENGNSILTDYPSLREVVVCGAEKEPFEESVRLRTKRNVECSDATLILVPHSTLFEQETVQDGTRLTIEHCQAIGKPHLLVAVDDNDKCGALEKVLDWVQETRPMIRILNIAGPRESSCPGIFAQTCEFLTQLFSHSHIFVRSFETT